MLAQEEKEIPLTQDSIDDYLEYLRSIGRVQGTLDSYRRKIKRLYQALPENRKMIRRDTLPQWREKLAEDGYPAAAINQCIIAANGYLEYMGAREFQVVDKLNSEPAPQPELTRSEYLRLLSAARLLGREQAYLLVKVFGNSNLPVQDLSRLTVEAARAGMLSVGRGDRKSSKEIIRFPSRVCQELLDYAQRCGVLSGPIFRTRTGKLLDRTNVTVSIRRLCGAAQVPEEKGSPRCLRKMYQSTYKDIERNIALLTEQAMERMLEEEQLTVGWDKRLH
ncbi:hypothetical protein N510_001293 [Firmicutes bacterium ASF500]|nr:hypothetical protein N510_000546 [Firmicutes bacterium ASF500]USF26365.1 hypothetical protein N510_001293 [Firmicutes bacterium ASF500]